MKVLIAAGGSGGHLLPAQQLARELKKNAEILFAGYRIDASPYFDQSGFAYQAISSAPIRFSVKGLYTFFIQAGKGIFQSIQLIRRYQPDVVVGFGSFHSFPTLFAAYILRRKIILFEANCLLGKVNRFFAHDAKFVATQFSLQKERSNQRLVPLLPWSEQKKLPDKKLAIQELGLADDRPIFLIFGGSQGAAFLNRTIPSMLPKNAQAIHLAGNREAALDVAERYKKEKIPAIVKSFESDMPKVYAAADFVICRSGAGTIAEMIRYQLPSLLIPFPAASDDHQTINAEFLAKKIYGATMLSERDADAKAISEKLAELMQDAAEYKKALNQFCKTCDGRQGLSQQILKTELL